MNQAAALPPLATDLAAAVARRHVLDRLADGGEAVPPELTHQAQATGAAE